MATNEQESRQTLRLPRRLRGLPATPHLPTQTCASAGRAGAQAAYRAC
jgi:hypothetical protein